MKYNKGFGIGIVIAIIALLAVGGIAYYTGKKSNYSQSKPQSQTQENNLKESNNKSIIQQKPVSNLTSCTTTSPSSVTLLSPNGGENFQAGQTIAVEWENCNLNANAAASTYVTITLERADSRTPVTFNNYDHTNDGSENLVIPSSIISGNYKLHIQLPTGSESPFILDRSDSTFNVAGVTPPCNNGIDPYSVTILSPNGGEQLQANQPITVKWTSCNIAQNVLMQPILVKENNEEYVASLYAISDDGNLKNDGMETYKLSQPVSPGQYRVKMNIHIMASGTMVEGVISDLSDSPFTIY